MDMLELFEIRSPESTTDDLNKINYQDKTCVKQRIDQSKFIERNSDEISKEMATAQSTLTTISFIDKSYHINLSISQNPMIKSFIFGSCSGTFSTLLLQPLDLLKTRLQNPNLKSQNFIKLSYNIIKDEKPSGLWKGTIPSLIRCVPGVGLYFCTLNALERSFCKNKKDNLKERPTALQAVLFGLTARCLVGFLLMPATVIKTRVESGLFNYKNLAKAFTSIYQSEGLRGLYIGGSATLMRDAPFSGIYYMFYTELQKFTKNNNVKREITGATNKLLSQSFISFFCGLSAGLAASIVTHPPDVIKTRMQLNPKKYLSIRLTCLAVLNEHGIKGFFHGIVPRMIRRTLMSSLAWTVYETFAQKYNLK